MATSYTDYLRNMRATIREVSVHDLADMRSKVPDLTLIDVREPDEFDNGVIPGARMVPRGFLEQRIETIEPDRQKPIALYCQSGNRSVMAARSLGELGYQQVVSVAGGISAWARAG